MALKFVSIGSAENVHVFDDGITPYAVETDAQMKVGTAPTVNDEVVRLQDIPAIGNLVTSLAVIADHAIVRGAGGVKAVQDSIPTIDDAGHIITPALWHAYGGFEDQAETIICGVGDWNHITNVANNLWDLDEGDGISEAADVITLANSGDYTGNLSLSLSAINGKDFHVRVYNNTQARVEGRPIGISTTGAGNEMNVSVPIYIEGTAADAIQFEIMSTDGTDPVVDDGIFVIAYLHS